MSNLLEEAIVDAKALKEAAMKNAQTAIVEKYSDEVKQAVDSLLSEQDPMIDPVDLSPSSDVVKSIPVGAMDGEVADKEMCGCPGDDEEVVITLPAIAAAADLDGEIEPSELEPELDLAPEDELPIEDEEEEELEEDLVHAILSALNEGDGPEVKVEEDKTEQHKMPAMETTEPLAKAKEIQQEREEEDNKVSEEAAEPAKDDLKEELAQEDPESQE